MAKLLAQPPHWRAELWDWVIAMYLNSRKGRLLLVIIEQAVCGHLDADMRRSVGASLLELLDADYFASFMWNQSARRFENRVAINMADENLDRYESNYQFRNPISAVAQQRRSATLVSQILPQHELVRTPFYAEFLRRDGLHYGLNLYVHDGPHNTGDIRLWRRKTKLPFDHTHAEVLDTIRPFFAAGIRNWLSVVHLRAQSNRIGHGIGDADFEALAHSYRLTDRETSIAEAIVNGRSDIEIANKLFLSITTVRTHLRSLYSKLRIHRRTEVLGRVLGVPETPAPVCR